jgi:cobalt-zinc-cadmium efflux system outer membrane protein
MGRFLALVGSTAAVLLGATPLSAAETLSLAHVLEVVRAHNPALEGARARADAAAALPARAGAYDDPVVSWEAWNIPESFAVDRADNNIVRVSQKIPFPGKRTLAADVARRAADAAGHDASATELEVATTAKRAYTELWRTHALRMVMDRDRALAERIAHVVEQRYGLGQATQTDALRAQVELAHAVGDLRTADLAIDDARSALAAVMSVGLADVTGLPADPPPPGLPEAPAILAERALASRPELASQDATIAQESTGLRLAQKGYLPDFEVSFGRFINSGRDDGFGASASMTVPLVWKGKYDAGVAEASARVVSAEAERRRVSDAIRRDVEQAYVRARTALVQHDLFGATHVPHAEQMLRVAEAAYASSDSDLTTLLEAMRNVAQVHLEHVNATADFEKAWADLERAVGSDLPRASAKEHRHD